MSVELLDGLLFAMVRSGTPLLLIAMGALLCEKSGVLNLGQEGLVLIGAASAFVATHATGDPYLGCLTAVVAGVGLSALFASLVIGLGTNQIATGLALTIFGTGLAAYLGSGYVGESISGIGVAAVPVLGEVPLVGRALFAQDALVYVTLALATLLWLVLGHSRVGTLLSAVGHHPAAAHQLGYRVNRVRLGAVLCGGALSAFAGAYLSVAYTPLWSESISAGRGWIALALVVFAGWHLPRVVLGAYLFGLASLAPLSLQGVGWDVPPNLLATLPYLVTIAALVVLSARADRVKLGPPQALGNPYRHGD